MLLWRFDLRLADAEGSDEGFVGMPVGAVASSRWRCACWVPFIECEEESEGRSKVSEVCRGAGSSGRPELEVLV